MARATACAMGGGGCCGHGMMGVLWAMGGAVGVVWAMGGCCGCGGGMGGCCGGSGGGGVVDVGGVAIWGPRWLWVCGGGGAASSTAVGGPKPMGLQPWGSCAWFGQHQPSEIECWCQLKAEPAKASKHQCWPHTGLGWAGACLNAANLHGGGALVPGPAPTPPVCLY